MFNKIIVFLLIMLCVPYFVLAQEKGQAVSLSGHGTYGAYSGSTQRDNIISETLNLSYIPNPENGLNLTVKNSSLNLKSPLNDINGTNIGAEYLWTPKTEKGSFIGGKVGALYINSDDQNSDNTFIPFLAMLYKSPDLRKYFDFGYARTAYNDTTANQFTVTGGVSLFNDFVWSQTRLYYIDLTQMVQGKKNTFAVEERFTYYAIPEKLSLTLYGMLGQRIYAYDPDLQTAYNLSDIHEGSAGVSLNYNLTKSVSVYGDVTYEYYNNNNIDDKYNVQYSTAGISISF
ncbi:MAG: hypothetical protein HZB80_00620 [Deltaproteobacteria bacterium]|nr:hypothetical protein [Deltaproteobacteria bacterium]